MNTSSRSENEKEKSNLTPNPTHVGGGKGHFCEIWGNK